MRIRTNSFSTDEEAIRAQEEFVCIVCRGALKRHQVEGGWIVLCVTNPHHRDLVLVEEAVARDG